MGAGSSTVEIGDCKMGVSSLCSRETMLGVVGGLRLEFGGTGLRLMKVLFVVSVGIADSDALVRSDDADALSDCEGKVARVFCVGRDGVDDVVSVLTLPDRNFRAFAFTESG
jgi:hypothetical protein